MISPRNLHTFELEAAELPTGDWTAHRDLAQEAVEAGYAAELTQIFNNDAVASIPLAHELRFLDPADVVEFDEGIEGQEDPMGGSVSVEQFTLNRPHGFFGQRTPLEDSPVQEDDPTEYSNIRLLRGVEESSHSTLTAALETVLRDQADLAWLPPKHHAEFDPDGPLDAGNSSPLLLDVNGDVKAEHLLEALRVAAFSEGERIIVAVGREDIGSVFKGTFEVDGAWSLEAVSVNGNRAVEGTGAIPATSVRREFSDAFESPVEANSRLSRADERAADEAVRREAGGLVQHLFTPTNELGGAANLQRLEHCQDVVDEFNRRQDEAYASSNSMYEPYVGPEPEMERLMIKLGGDIHAVLHSSEFESNVQSHLDLAATEVWMNDEDGQRYEQWDPSQEDLDFVSSVVEATRRLASESATGEVDLAVPPQAQQRQVSVMDAVDAQAAGSMAQVLNSGPPVGSRASLSDSNSQSVYGSAQPNQGQSFSQSGRSFSSVNRPRNLPPTQER